jgi:hypothetical protein
MYDKFKNRLVFDVLSKLKEKVDTFSMEDEVKRRTTLFSQNNEVVEAIEEASNNEEAEESVSDIQINQETSEPIRDSEEVNKKEVKEVKKTKKTKKNKHQQDVQKIVKLAEDISTADNGEMAKSIKDINKQLAENEVIKVTPPEPVTIDKAEIKNKKQTTQGDSNSLEELIHVEVATPTQKESVPASVEEPAVDEPTSAEELAVDEPTPTEGEVVEEPKNEESVLIEEVVEEEEPESTEESAVEKEEEPESTEESAVEKEEIAGESEPIVEETPQEESKPVVEEQIQEEPALEVQNTQIDVKEENQAKESQSSKIDSIIHLKREFEQCSTVDDIDKIIDKVISIKHNELKYTDELTTCLISNVYKTADRITGNTGHLKTLLGKLRSLKDISIGLISVEEMYDDTASISRKLLKAVLNSANYTEAELEIHKVK